MRPKQWAKNLFIFAGILFSRNFFNCALVPPVIYAFIIFCLLSGMVYLINDWLDLKSDRQHPQKSRRPLAAGKLNPVLAFVVWLVMVPALLFLAYRLQVWFFVWALIYFLLQLFYSFFLKHVVILDVFSIAFSFVARVVAGAVVIGVAISSWLLICTMLLALFIGLGKRRHELLLLGEGAIQHRAVLDEYSPYLLDQMIGVVTASIIVAYALYTVAPETVAKVGTSNLIYTVPFVLYGVFRYLYLIHQKGLGGSPENILFGDLALLVDIVLWIASAVCILYLV
jgi:4-hydroxybenzoate polyprenyltransferase